MRHEARELDLYREFNRAGARPATRDQERALIDIVQAIRQQEDKDRRRARLIRIAAIAAVLVGVALTFAGCSILEPATELQVINDVPAAAARDSAGFVIQDGGLQVAVRSCGAGYGPVTLDAHLAAGASRTWEVRPGCWRVEGSVLETLVSPGGQASHRVRKAGEVEVTVASGTLHKVPFYEPEGVE